MNSSEFEEKGADNFHELLDAILNAHSSETSDVVPTISYLPSIRTEIPEDLEIEQLNSSPEQLSLVGKLNEALKWNSEQVLSLKYQLNMIENELKQIQEITHKIKYMKAEIQKEEKYFHEQEYVSSDSLSTSSRKLPPHEEKKQNDGKISLPLCYFLGYFVDRYGQMPPDNPDCIIKQTYEDQFNLLREAFKKKRWTMTERLNLKRGVRQQNQQLILRPFLQTYQQLNSNEEGRKNIEKALFCLREKMAQVCDMTNEQLEINTEGIDWEHVSRVYVLNRNPVECRIRYMNVEHPNIKKDTWTLTEDHKLFELAKKYNSCHWRQISQELSVSRTPAQCFQRYQIKLNPDVVKRKWTIDEDHILAEAIRNHGEKNWQVIANMMYGRTGQQCLHRWQKVLHPNIRRGRWTSEEDILLRNAVKIHGTKNWFKVRQYVLGRTDVQCRERWFNVLDPHLKKGPWNSEEDERLIRAIRTYGVGKWAQICQDIPFRTDNQNFPLFRSAGVDSNFLENINHFHKIF